MEGELTTEKRLPGKILDIPLPPALYKAFEYPGHAQFVAFHWPLFSDDLEIDDGQSRSSTHGWAFREYQRHAAVAPLLNGHGMGEGDEEPTHALVIDRIGNRASVAPIQKARAFIRGQQSRSSDFQRREGRTRSEGRGMERSHGEPGRRDAALDRPSGPCAADACVAGQGTSAAGEGEGAVRVRPIMNHHRTLSRVKKESP